MADDPITERVAKAFYDWFKPGEPEKWPEYRRNFMAVADARLRALDKAGLQVVERWER